MRILAAKRLSTVGAYQSASSSSLNIHYVRSMELDCIDFKLPVHAAAPQTFDCKPTTHLDQRYAHSDQGILSEPLLQRQPGGLSMPRWLQAG